MFPATSHLEGAQRIGAGGCGLVYSANHARWGKVAVKVAISAEAEICQLFNSEYTLLRSLRHRAILKAHDYFLLEDRRPVIVMQLCDGGDFYQGADRMETRDRFRNLGQVLSALEYLHLLGMVHRDLKGENILLSTSAGAQLSDLGLAAAKDSETRERGGTLEYMAPEVIDNRGATPESDIYSLGVILYRLATRALPFISADPLQIISRKQTPDSAPWDDLAQKISPRFAKLVRQCIDPNPAERPKAIKDVAEQLVIDNLISAADFGLHQFDDYFHHHIYSYNASFCKQELKTLPSDVVVEHVHQAEATELGSSISDYLKLNGYSVTTKTDLISYSNDQATSRSSIRLCNRAVEKSETTKYTELDRFAFDATLSKLITKEVDPATADIIYKLTSGNLALVAALLRQLEREDRFDIRSGKLRLAPLEIYNFAPDQRYFEFAKEMIPRVPQESLEVAEFLASDTGDYPVGELITLGRLDRRQVDELQTCGFLENEAIARGYYRAYFYHTLDSVTSRRFHADWVKVIDETDSLPAITRERLLLHHHSLSGDAIAAVAAAMRLADLLQGEQELEEASSVLEFGCSLKGNRGDMRQYVKLLMNRANVLNKLGDFTKALSEYSKVVRFGRQIDDKEAVASAYKCVGDVYKGKRDYRRGSRALDRAIKFYGEEGDELELSHCYNNIGNICWINGDIADAATNYEKALTIQRSLGAMRDIASTLSNLGWIRYSQRNVEGSIVYFKESIEIKKQLNDLPELARTYNNLSVVYFEQDELLTSQDYLKQALEINQKIGAISELNINYDNFYEIEFRRGNYAKSREWLIEGLKNSPREADSVRGGFITSLAGLSILEGRYSKAGALIAAARAREAKVTDKLLSMRVAATGAEYYYCLQDFGQAYDHIQAAIEIADKIGETKNKASFLIRRSRVERAISRPLEEIAATLEEAEQLLAEVPAKRERHELILDYAELALVAQDADEMEAQLAQAIDFPEFDGIVTFRWRLYLLRGILEMQRGNFGRAVHFANDAVLAAKSLRMPESLWYSLSILGDCQRKQNQLEQSL
ncbi:MAG: serine/threonine-protein kinase, partial [Candidatus Zixiibacteriota bacterium]